MHAEQLTIDDSISQAEVRSLSATLPAQNAIAAPPEKLDTKQFGRQLRAVFDVMKDGRWRTLTEIAFAAKTPEASVSARIRDLANQKGIEHEKRKAKEGRLYEYWLQPRVPR